VVDYLGEVIETAEVNRRYPADALAAYTLRLSSEYSIDAALLRGVGAYINASRRGARPNVEWKPNPRTRSARFTATKFIAAGTELMVSYGRAYWYDKHATHSTDDDPSEWIDVAPSASVACPAAASVSSLTSDLTLLTLCVPGALDTSSTGRGEHCCMTGGKGRGVGNECVCDLT